MKQDILNLNNENVGNIELSESVFGLEVRKDILHRVVDWQLAKLQSGNHQTKGRSDVSRTGAKPWKQKGGGRARAGSRAISQFRGGGVVFGPVVRDHSYKLTKKFRKLGLKTALSAKASEGKLVILDDVKLDLPKTKELKAKLSALNLEKVLFIGGSEIDMNFALAIRNIVGVDVLPQQGANVYDIIKKDTLVLTKEAVESLEARLK